MIDNIKLDKYVDSDDIKICGGVLAIGASACVVYKFRKRLR